MTTVLKHDAHDAQTGLVAGRFHFRRLDPAADVPRLTRFLNEMEAIDQIDRSTTEERERDNLQEPPCDAAQDGWVVEEPGHSDRLIAQNYVYKVLNSPRALVYVEVHPAWRRQGLGQELLARSLARAREQGNHYVFSVADDGLPGSETFLLQHGFRRVVNWVLMRCPGETALAAPAWPAGYTLRTYTEVPDVRTVATALNRGFIGHWENRERSLEEIAHRLHGPGVYPDGIFLAFGPAGDIAGICWADYDGARNAQMGEAVGHIASLGVVPEHRRHGLGRALLLTGLHWLRAQGMAAIALDAMGNNELALPLYDDVGFHIRRQGGEYRLDLLGT